MAKILVVTSGKGGVGKTTTSAAIGTGLALRGHKTVIVDFDVGLRNLDLIMGCERRVVYDFVNVVHGEATLKQALIKDKRFDNLYVLAASQTRDKDALTQEGVGKVLKDLAANQDLNIRLTEAEIESAEKASKAMGRMRAEHNFVAQTIVTAALPALEELVGELKAVMLGTHNTADAMVKLRDDGTLKTWAQDTAYGIAIVIDALRGVIQMAKAVMGSFEAVWADIELLGTFLAGGKGLNPFSEENQATLKTALEKRNAIVEKANQTYVDLWKMPLLADAVKERFDAINRGETEAAGEAAKPKLNYNSATGRVDVSYAAPTSLGGSTVSGYVIQVSKDGGATWSSLTYPNATTFAVAVPAPLKGQTWSYRVVATTRFGSSQPSSRRPSRRSSRSRLSRSAGAPRWGRRGEGSEQFSRGAGDFPRLFCQVLPRSRLRPILICHICRVFAAPGCIGNAGINGTVHQPAKELAQQFL